MFATRLPRILRPGMRPPNAPTFSRQFTSTSTKQRRYVRFGEQPGTYTDTSNRWWNASKWSTRQRVAAGIVTLGGVYYVTHLEQVPETGRWRFMDVSPEMKTRLEETARKELMEEFGAKTLPPNHALTRHVHRIVSRILEANHLGTLKTSTPPSKTWFSDPFQSHADDPIASPNARQWELMVVKDDKIVNAMASFGTVIVFTGILPMAKDEEGLAAILGHEIGHAVAQHSLERYSSTKILLALTTLVSIIGLDFGLSRALSTLVFDLPNSRKQELEADAIGMRLAAQACYDPRAAPEVFTRMEQIDKANRGLNVNFLHTHPTFETRVERLNKLLPDAYAIRDGNPDCVNLREQVSGFRDAMGLVRGAPSTIWGWA